MQWPRGWHHDSESVDSLTPEHMRGVSAPQTERAWVDPLRRQAICDRGLCLERMEFLLHARKYGSGCEQCVLPSPCAHLHLLRFAAPDTEFHVYQSASGSPAVSGVVYHAEAFTAELAPRCTWALFGSEGEPLKYHEELLAKCVPSAGYLLVVLDLEPKLPQGNFMFPLWAPFDSRSFILKYPVTKSDFRNIALQTEENRQAVNMAMLLLELNQHHREVRRYTHAYDAMREQCTLGECVDAMGFAGTPAAAPLVELLGNILPPRPEHEVAQLLELLHPGADLYSS